MASSNPMIRQSTVWPRLWAGWTWLGLLAIVFAVSPFLFGRGVVVVVESFRQPEFSHGYIIPMISAWILWQRRDLIWAQRSQGAWTGWLVVLAGVGLALFCYAAKLFTPAYVALLVTVTGFAATGLGWAATRLLFVPILFLLLAYPLPDYLFIALSTKLQLVSSVIGAAVLDALRIPVYLDGNIIDLGTMKLQVAEACSGLRYLLPLLSFGILCAFIYRAPLWAKLVVVAMTVPLTIVLNGLRIALTGLFVHYGNIELAEGFMHLFEGWAIFLLALAILFVTMYGLLRLTGWRGPFVDMLDFDRMAGTPGGRQPEPAAALAPALAIPPRPFVASVATVVGAALLLIPLAARPQIVPDRPGLLGYPMTLGSWQAVPHFLDPTTARVLGANDYLLLDFVEGTSPPINLWVAYYESLIRGPSFHSPTTCLPGAGWEYVELRSYRTPFVDFSGAPLMVNRGLVAHGEQRIVMYFWTELRGRSVRGLQYVKFFNLWDSLVSGRSDGALVRVYTPLLRGEDPTAGDARLLAFLELAYAPLEPHVGE